MTGHFRFSQKSHCSSGIVAKGFFYLFFNRSFPHFSYKKVPDSQKISLFPLYYFSQKIPPFIAILFLTPLKSEAEQGLHFRKASIPRGIPFQSQHSILQCHGTQTFYKIISHISFWFIRLWYKIKKEHFFLNAS